MFYSYHCPSVTNLCRNNITYILSFSLMKAYSDRKRRRQFDSVKTRRAGFRIKVTLLEHSYCTRRVIIFMQCPTLSIWHLRVQSKSVLRAATNESQKTRNKKQETKRFSTFAVSRLRHSETKKQTLLDSRIKFLAKHVWNSQSTIYLKSHGCVHGLQNEMSLVKMCSCVRDDEDKETWSIAT